MSYAAFLAKNLKNTDLQNFAGMSFSKLNSKLNDGKTIPKTGKAMQQKITDLAAQYLGIPLASKPKGQIDGELLKPISLYMAKTNMFLPLAEVGGKITVAIASPEKSLPYVDDYARIIGKETSLAYMPEAELTKLIHSTFDHHTQTASAVVDDMESDDLQSLASELNEPADLLDSNDDAPIIRLINTILSQAMKENASDIHIEPFEKIVKVRFRVDGVMHTVITPNAKLQSAISARLKVMASLDIAEKRLPQDGRFKIRLAGRETDIRISTLPTQHGERIVLRLLGQQEGIRKLEQIGLRPAQVEKIRSFFNLPHGMIFIAGPTGSGKTSTLYAGLTEINTPYRNIVTVEDPVEYELEGLGQIPVNAKIGMTFATGLRSILRQDPDVVVVGETRDLETAQIATEASLTGHLVLSTIHTNDAPSTITRLIEMGIEPFLAASSMRAVIAQRMVRKLHPIHKKPLKPDAKTLELFNCLPENIRPQKISLFEPMPCDDCPTGYSGRTGIFEILTVTDAIRQQIHTGASDVAIRETAQNDGMLTLFQEGLLLAATGETTVEEVIRVTKTQG